MRDLLLLRHAKSSRDDAGLADHERPLAQRGRGAAKAMGVHMRKRGFIPDVVFCSPARRARETWDIVRKHMRFAGHAEVLDELYDFGDGSRLLQVIRNRGGASQSLLLVGHNPSLEGLAQRLIGSGEPELREKLAGKYPTGALAILRLDIAAWPDTALASGELRAFVRPKDVMGTDPD